MRQHIRIFLPLVFLCFAIQPLFAFHLVGGSITYECRGKNASGLNRYFVKVEVYRDCENSTTEFDDPITIGVFDRLNRDLVQTDNLNLGPETILPVEIDDPCAEPPTDICYARTIYSKEILLPDNPNGYVISWLRCCRNTTIVNLRSPAQAGMTLAATIMTTAICSDSPIFTELVPTFICRNDAFSFDHSAIDTEGDSLVYRLVTPYNGGSQNDPIPAATPPPYNPVEWLAPYNLANIVGGNPAMEINTETGFLTAYPEDLGQFAFAVEVQEYRNGQLVGIIRREIQTNIIDCAINFPPRIFYNGQPYESTDTLEIYAGEETCINIRIQDVNGPGVGVDQLTIEAEGDMLPGGSIGQPYAEFIDDSGFAPLEAQLCWTPTCDQAGVSGSLILTTSDDNDCPAPNVVVDTVQIKVLDGRALPPSLRCVSVEANNQIRLSWTNPGEASLLGFDAYEIYRQDANGNWNLIESISDSLQTTWVDNGVTNAHSEYYCYQMLTRRFCPDAKVSNPSPSVCSYLAQHTSLSDVQSQITWDTYGSPWQFPSYYLYADSLYAEDTYLTSYTHTACFFSDYFYVETIDPESGCVARSGRTELVEHQDNPPSNIDLCVVTNSALHQGLFIEWEALPETDFTAYRLYRRARTAANWELIHTQTDRSLTSYVDSTAQSNSGSYCYRLEVEDLCGNVLQTAADCSIWLDADELDYQVKLNWTPYQGWGAVAQNLWTLDESGQADQLKQTIAANLQSYLDQEVGGDDATYCYQMQVQGGVCNAEAWSNTVCVSFPPTIFIPNAFSPNGDGINDLLEVKALFLSEYRIQIFNRWGNLVYESDALSESWNGTDYLKGKPQPEGVYVMVVDAVDADGNRFQQVGSVTLIR